MIVNNSQSNPFDILTSPVKPLNPTSTLAENKPIGETSDGGAETTTKSGSVATNNVQAVGYSQTNPTAISFNKA